MKNLSVHAVRRHPLTGDVLKPVGFRNDGRPIWPTMGASEDPDPAETDPPENQAGNAETDPPTNPNSGGFPANTPVDQMTPAQQAAYWKDKARKHEARAGQWSGLGKSVDEVKKIIDENQTDAEKAIADARSAGRAEGLKEGNTVTIDTIIDVTLKTAGVKREDVPAIAVWDYTKFLKEDGTVDTDKVTAVLSTTLNSNESSPPKPGHLGQGPRANTHKTAKDAGVAEAERRFGKDK